MPRDTRNRTVYVCVDGFSPAAPAGAAPVAFRPGQQVMDDDPILKTHRQFFVPAADRVEQATAAPGERRPIVPPTDTPDIHDDDKEPSNG
jgi:hypothetical protein